MPAHRKWYPRSLDHTHLGLVQIWLRERSQGWTILQEWQQFLQANKDKDSATLILGYVAQQLCDGMDPSSISSRLKMLRYLGTPMDPEGQAKARLKLLHNSVKRELIRRKNQIGTGHRPLVCLETLMKVYAKPPSTKKDRQFQIFFYLLVVTGQRAANLIGASVQRTSEGLHVTFAQGRKNDKQALRASILFRFEWSHPPPAHLDQYIKSHFQTPGVGTESSVSSNMNTWLRKQGHCLTSTVPRTRLDNILRVLLEHGVIKTEEYERIMDHTVSTSDKHYYAL